MDCWNTEELFEVGQDLLSSVKHHVFVLGVRNLISALQPPHRLPHVFGLKRRSVPPLLTNIQGYRRQKKTKRGNWTAKQKRLSFMFKFFLLNGSVNRSIFTFLNYFPNKNLGDPRHGNNHILRHWWACYGLDQLEWKRYINRHQILQFWGLDKEKGSVFIKSSPS